MIIQVLLIATSVLILFYFLTNRNTMQVRAYNKIALLIFIVAIILFVLNPDSLNRVANWVGVGRGADLVLYALFIAFVILALNVYMKFKEQQDKTNRLARKIALLEAKNEFSKKNR